MRTIHIYDDFSICYFTVSERGNEENTVTVIDLS